MRCTSSRSPSARSSPANRRRPGWSTASSATCWSMRPATPIAPSSASTSCSRPTPPSGRRGLLELRAFEMPPHWRMSVAQQALLRGLVAKFWDRPYERTLSALGHAPARRFHAAALRLAGFFRRAGRSRARPATASQPDWFAPHFEFRFPRIGEVAQRGIELELRHALEPWHVLGEEPGGGGTVRYVDSSVERLQVKVDGLNDAAPCHRLQRLAPAAARHRHGRRVRRGRALSRLAAGQRAASDHRRARAAHLRHPRHAGAAGRSAAAAITSPIPAAATTTACRSTPTRPRPAAAPASSRSAIHRATCPNRGRSTIRSIR